MKSVPELKQVLGGIGLPSNRAKDFAVAESQPNHPLDGVVRRQIINSSYVPNNSP